MLEYLTQREERNLRRLYGLKDEEEITESDEGSQVLFYARHYNIAYRDKGDALHYGNPLRDMCMTDREYNISPQWLSGSEDSHESYHDDLGIFNVKELTEILDALAVLQDYADNCPDGMEMIGKIINNQRPFRGDGEKVRNFLRNRPLLSD